MKSQEKTILFDLDGTLIDSTEAILESFEVALGQFGDVAPDEEAIKAQIGHPLDVMFRTLGVPQERVWAHVDAYKAHYRQISCQKTVLLPYATEAIALAKAHARLGIVTTKTALYSKEMLTYMGVMEHFEVLIGREDVTHPKPHPEPIYKALDAMGASATSAYMIGDTPMDMEAAKAAEVLPVGVSCGYAEETTLCQYTPNVFQNAYEAVKFIVGL